MQIGQLARTENEGAAPFVQATAGTAMQVIHTHEGLDALSPAWDALAAQAGNPLLDLSWIRACASTFAPNGRLHVIVAGEPPHLTAIAPLVRRQNGSARLELLGVNELYEPADFLFEDHSALVTLVQGLVRSGIPIWLKRVPADSPIVAALRQAYRWPSVAICRPSHGSPWISLQDGWRQPEQQLSRSRREYLKRARRIAEQMGPVRCEIASPTPAELGPLMKEAFLVEAAGWKGRGGSALAYDAAIGTFYRHYTAAASRKGTLRLCFLRIGDRAVAMQIAVEYGDCFWLLKIGYDEAFARCSPGALLMLETVRHAAARGLRSYELLGTDESWTHMWTSHVRPCVSLLAYPANGKGVAAMITDAAIMARSKLGGVL